MNETVSQILEIDFSDMTKNIKTFIKKSLTRLNRNGAVIGLSGGLDSAVVAILTVQSLGAENVHLINMPDQDSKPFHQDHAQLLAKHLGIPLITQTLTPLLRKAGTYKLLPLKFLPSRRLRGLFVKIGEKILLSRKNAENFLITRMQPKANSFISKGNSYSSAKHRMRMVVLYQYAEVHNLMVVGAANRTEWLTGTFSKWGVDQCADIMPVLHVYRSQLEDLAEFLEVPSYIRKKAPDPDVIPGVEDKGKLLGDMKCVDQILNGIEKNQKMENFYEEFGKDTVNLIVKLYNLSSHMRNSPFHL